MTYVSAIAAGLAGALVGMGAFTLADYSGNIRTAVLIGMLSVPVSYLCGLACGRLFAPREVA